MCGVPIEGQNWWLLTIALMSCPIEFGGACVPEGIIKGGVIVVSLVSYPKVV